MNYKLICLDMDGTLLNDEKEISDRNKEAIKSAIEKGVKVAICTGRLFTAANEYADMLGIKAPVISANGAYIREKDRNEIIYKSIFELKNAKAVLDIAKQYNISLNFHTPDSIYTERSNKSYELYLKYNKNAANNNKINLQIVDNLYETLLKNKDDILKCIAIEDDIELIKKVKEELRKLPKVEVVSSSENNFEVMQKGVSKGRGVEMLAAYYGIDKSEVICIGDNENDLTMIEYAGLGIAMGNSEQAVIAKAKYITDTNNNDGVAKAIEKFIIND
jgi:Cof subfamily protein (haloacid dehalogenase superfamily)